MLILESCYRTQSIWNLCIENSQSDFDSSLGMIPQLGMSLLWQPDVKL